MNIKIEMLIKKIRGNLDIEKLLGSYLKQIPVGHLVGLERIVVVDEIAHIKNTKARGLYHKKDHHEPATIEIALDSVYKGMPKIIYYIPFIPKFLLANTLYHEIGHHYQTRLTHGIRKTEQEAFAETYTKKMLKTTFWWWLILLFPFKPLIIYLRDRAKSSI
jgi:hypothetical protein